MKRTTIALFIGLTAALISPAGAADNEAAKKDVAQLQGEWTMVSGIADGQAMPEETRATAKRICQGNETTVTVGGQLMIKAKFTVDPGQKPKTIDYDMIDGWTKGKKQLGIYELDGDTVKFCFAAPDGERPADFSSKPGERRTLSVWKRQKEPAAEPKKK